jgi:fatty-acyl-CoA synthase
MLNQGTGSWSARRARMTPGKTAIVGGGRHYSYAELSERVTGTAHRLRELGVRPGDRVAYLGRNLPELPQVLFAAGTLGAVFVPLNFRLAPPELAAILDDCAPSVLIWDEAFADTVVAVRGTASVRDWLGVADIQDNGLQGRGPGEPIDIPVSLDDLCMIQYTSGTSGRPKGVQLSHGNIAWNCFNALLDVDVASDEVILVCAPMFHAGALNNLFLPAFLKGGTAVLMTEFDPARALDLIAEHGVTWMFGVPAMYSAMTRAPGWDSADLSSVRSLMCAGAPVPETLISTYIKRGLTFAQGYGLTESSPGATFLRASESVFKAGSAGTPCFFADVRVVRPDLTYVAPHETGQILVSGPNVTSGYWKQPGIAPFAADGWLATGDAATLDEDGYLYVRGRLKDMFISGGENVYPAEVEQVILQHPAVAECAVISLPDEQWGEVGRAVVVPRPGTDPAPGDVLGFLNGKLARYKIPKSVVFAIELPRNATGKVAKASLQELYGGKQ